MSNEAVGIAINGREVKIAHVHRDKDRLAVDYLESAVLTSDMEHELRKKAEEEAAPSYIQNEEDIFSQKNPLESKASSEKESSLRENVDVLYSLLRKFSGRRIKVAFNVPPSRVSFQELDTHLDYNKNEFKGTLRKKIENWKQGFNAIDNVSVITRKDGTLCNVSCEIKEPPILDILEQLNTFFKGNLVLSLMDPNEVSLVNLARNSYDFRDESKITVIVEIETEFSRIIFMKGEDLLTASPIIPESFNPDIFSIVYSKIIYELDNLNIPEANNVLLAGKASTNAAKTFFGKKFPDAKVGFIISQPLAENLSSQFSREDLSDYAIPISSAWKVIQKKEKGFIPTNLLPSQIIERQKVLSLPLAGYLILVLLGISAFILTWKITAKKIEVSSLKTKNQELVERINSSEETVRKVHELEDQIGKITKRLVLSDSLSYGSDRLLIFLDRLNLSVSKIKSVWIEEVKNTKNGILIKGMSLKRGDIPKISEELGNARINKLTRSKAGNQRLFSFEMEVNWNQEPFRPDSENKFEMESPPPLKAKANETKLVTKNTSEWGTSTKVTQSIVAEENMGVAKKSKIVKSTGLSGQNYKNKNDQTTNNLVFAAKELKNQNVQKIEKSEKSQPLNIEKKTDFAGYKNDSIKKENENLLNNGSRFIITVNAHANKFTAMKDVEYYRSNGFDSYITTLPNSSREIPYWVCVGDFNNYDEAENELKRLNTSIPGKRHIIKISEDDFMKPIASNLKTESFSSIKNSSSQLIKKADHAMVLNEDKHDEKTLTVVESNSRKYTISVSAHVTKFTARKDVQFYRSKSIETYITTLPNSSQEIPYWVCYGDFSSYGEAAEKIKQLSAIVPRKYNIVEINK